jgi:pyruvate kinase
MPIKDPRKTKIVCTIGPASESPQVLEKLVRAGMNVARLNFSHGTHDEHRAKLHRLRAISKKLGRPVAVIQDLCGPKIRTGEIETPIPLKYGQTIALSGKINKPRNGVIPVSYPRLAADVKVGDAILLADGVIELEVTKIEGALVYCKVHTAGAVGRHKGVNIPAEALSISGITAKDIQDLDFAVNEEIDYVALSFVRSAADVLRLKKLLAQKGRAVPVIAKIEKPQALECIDAIIAATDGVMVARGDLGVEIPFDQVPGVQKMLIRKANQAGKPVITATQMLKSMVDSPKPTRAEVTDVANAIWDGTDAIMLSEETASGKYPEQAVKVMDRIGRTVEAEMAAGKFIQEPFPAEDPIPDAISFSAHIMAEELQTRAIVCPTRSGATARHISRYRPDPPIIALTPSRDVVRRLCLTWGVVPILTPELKNPVNITEQAFTLAKKYLPLKRGDRILITAGTSRANPGMTNTIRLEVV